MKRKIATIIGCFILSLSGVVLYGSQNVVLAMSIGCGDTILEDTTLEYDLLDCPDDGLIIGADNIVLNGNGYTVDGQEEGSGVVVHSRSGAIISNLKVTGFSTGISLHQSHNVMVKNNWIVANNRGVRLSSSTSNTINFNEFSDNYLAIRFLFSSHDNIVVRNVVRGTQANAINLQNSNGNIVTKNKLVNNGHGISLFQSNQNTVSMNKISTTIDAGVKLIASLDNIVSKNKSIRNGGDGFEVDSDSSGNTFLGNACRQNQGFGFIDFSTGNTGDLGTDNNYVKNKCTRNDLGGSSPLLLCSPQS